MRIAYEFVINLVYHAMHDIHKVSRSMVCNVAPDIVSSIVYDKGHHTKTRAVYNIITKVWHAIQTIIE